MTEHVRNFLIALLLFLFTLAFVGAIVYGIYKGLKHFMESRRRANQRTSSWFGSDKKTTSSKENRGFSLFSDVSDNKTAHS
jgi:cbb3-type cytochrome oxidase subunit 3